MCVACGSTCSVLKPLVSCEIATHRYECIILGAQENGLIYSSKYLLNKHISDCEGVRFFWSNIACPFTRQQVHSLPRPAKGRLDIPLEVVLGRIDVGLSL